MWPVSCVFVPGNCSGGRSAAVSPLTSGFAKSLARCLTRLHAGASPGASALLRRAARGERRAPWAGRRAAVAYRRARSPARRSRAMRRSQPSQLLDAPIGRGAWKAAGPEPPAAPGGEAQARQAGRSRGNTPRPDRRSRRGRRAQPRALYGPWRGSQRRRARRHRDPAGVRAPEDPSRCDRAPPRAPAMPLRLRAEGGPADRGDRACLLRLRSPGACLLPRRLPAPPLRAHGRAVRRRARHGGLGRGARLDGRRGRRAPGAVPRGHEGPVERGPGRLSRRGRHPGAGEPALGARRLERASTLLECHKPRGREAIDAIGVMEKMAGVAVHDGGKPCRTDDVVHALCNAHHVRELEAIGAPLHEGWAQEMEVSQSSSPTSARASTKRATKAHRPGSAGGPRNVGPSQGRGAPST